MVRIEVVGRKLRRVRHSARDVDRGRERAARVADQLVDRRSRDRRDAVKRLAVARAVAAGEDAAVVAEDAVVAAAARDPVGAVAADDRVVLPVAEHDVVARPAVDEVVAGFAVDLAALQHAVDERAADIARNQGTGRARVIRAARRVVEQRDCARDDSLSSARVAKDVVVELQEAVRTGALSRHPVRAHEPEDVAVVRDDGIGVVRLAVCRGVARVVQADHRPRAAEDDVRAVLALSLRRLAEEVGAAADDVVLALVAEDDVVAGAALDVVVAVRGCVE